MRNEITTGGALNVFFSRLSGVPVQNSADHSLDLRPFVSYGFNTAPPYSGTIVYLTGDGGLNGGDAGSLNYYAQYYTQHGYQLVEVAWGDYTTKGTPWEEAWQRRRLGPGGRARPEY